MAFGFDSSPEENDRRFVLQEFNARLAPLLQRYKRTDRKVPNWRSNRLSQHVFGTAADFQVAPGQISSFMREARAQGLIPVNEPTASPSSPDWTGPHVHVQLFPAAPAGSTPAQVSALRVRANIPSRPVVQLSEAP